MKKLLFCCLVILYSSCTLKDRDKIETKSYFDLSAYFKAEASRLTKANLKISKTVIVNGKSEEKSIKISNWEKEFDSFISSDINKASWKGSFQTQKNDTLETYTSQSDKIPIKQLQISYKNKKLFSIKVFVSNTNDLYASKDSLSYYPDSLYQIHKVQKIKLMDKKEYFITGRFK